MIILAIDPGYDRLGLALMKKEQGNSREQILFSDCIQTNSKDDYLNRLQQIQAQIAELIDSYHPEVLVLESLFFSRNTKTALRVSEARGLILAEALRRDMSVTEFTPNQIKVAVTGYGAASKDDMSKMVKQLVKLEKPQYIDDEIDAIATGICYFARTRI